MEEYHAAKRCYSVMSEGRCTWHITLTSRFTNIITLCGHKEFSFILCEIYSNIYLKDNINAVFGRDPCDKTLCGVGGREILLVN